MKAFLACLVFLSLVCFSSAQTYNSTISIGDTLFRTFTVYQKLPTSFSEASSLGWAAKSSSCDKHLGIEYTVDGKGATSTYPLSIYFTPAGQVTGVSVRIYGQPMQKLIHLKYFEEVDTDVYRIAVTFRTNPCTNEKQSDLPLGDRLVVNNGGIARELPITEGDAIKQGFVKGACFYGMGHHYFFDLAEPGKQTWMGANLLPIVVMYDKGLINSFFFASTDVQQGITGAHQWEPIALANPLMCGNWCDDSCTFHDTSFWSTLHIYLKDYTKVTCSGGCTVSCCP